MGQNFLAGGLVIQLEVNKFGLDLWRMGKEKSGSWIEDWEDGNGSRASFATEESYFKKELFRNTSTIFNDFLLLGWNKLEQERKQPICNLPLEVPPSRGWRVPWDAECVDGLLIVAAPWKVTDSGSVFL